MTPEELARATGESVQDLRRWRDLGLLKDGESVAAQVERVRLIRFAAERGVPPDEVARVCTEQGDMLETFLHWAPTSEPTKLHTLDEAAALAGLDRRFVERVWAASGLRGQRQAGEDDLEGLRRVATARALGVPDVVLLQVLRVFADSFAKVASSATRLFHLYVHEQLRAQGLRGAELLASTQSIGSPLLEFLEPGILYFLRKSWERANREDFVVRLLEESTAPSAVPGELVRTIVFVDLSSFTSLTEAMGDSVAAQVVEQFSDMVRSAAASYNGEVVKQIGDAFMLVFPDGRSAINCALAIEELASHEPRFPAVRIGAHTGSVLFREGDYLGAAVNLAARVADAARRHEFLATPVVVEAGGSIPKVRFRSLGSRSLKGFADEIELVAVESESFQSGRSVDPVCGMELDLGSAEAALSWHGEQLEFCSASCLRQFLTNPERYRPLASAP